VLPRGWRDFVLQLLLFLVVDVVYELSRGLSSGDIVLAFAHARDVVSLERGLGVFTELDVQHFALHHPVVLWVANMAYFHAHFAVTVVFMFWLYLRRNDHYYFVRNIVFIADAIALAGYIALPTAPPRMLTDVGFVDTLEKYGSINHDSGLLASLANPFAAVPSVHTCYSLIFGITGFCLVRRAAVRALWPFYPCLIVFSIVATANHFWIDAVAGALVALVSFAIARALERVHPTLPASARARLRLPARPREVQGAAG
jgi:hypothetical protein